MMQPENEGGPETPTKAVDDILMDDDVEAPGSASKGKAPGADDEISLDKLKIRFLAIAQYLKQELSTMDAEKAKRLGFQAKEKAVLMALAFKALMLQYVNELKQMDKAKAKELGIMYQGKAKELGKKYQAKTVEFAGVAHRRALHVASELKTMDKQKSIEMMRKGKVVYKEMSTGTKIKYGILFCFFFLLMGTSPGGSYNEVKHKHLCYFHDDKIQPEQKVAMCEKMLAGVTKGYTNWIFIGNQPVFALFSPFFKYTSGKDNDVETKPFRNTKGDRGKKRKVQFYYKYEVPDADEWTKKYKGDQKNEIANDNGPGQADCGHCPMVKLEGKKKDMVVEALLVEASRDVSQVTTTTSTTQETVAKYLGETYPDKKKTACVVQQGTYEMTKAPWKTTEQYLQHTKEFHDKLEEHCGILIRIGQMSDHGDLKKKINEWNAGTRDVVLQSSRNGYFIDISQVSNPSPESYTEPMWGMFSRLSKALE